MDEHSLSIRELFEIDETTWNDTSLQRLSHVLEQYDDSIVELHPSLYKIKRKLRQEKRERDTNQLISITLFLIIYTTILLLIYYWFHLQQIENSKL
jgi:hypothetical protein